MTPAAAPNKIRSQLSRVWHETAAPAGRSASTYNPALGYLRAFLTVLVVAHHAALAYHPFAPPLGGAFADEPRLWRAFPIIDAARTQAAALLVGFNDVFFMSLLFFVSGVFVWPSLRRKGAARFFRDRVLRLGVPFAVGAALLAPVAYYPAFLQRHPGQSFDAFLTQWLTQPDWPSGPVWFIWVLLAFNCVAAALYRFAPSPVEAAGVAASRGFGVPSGVFHAIIAGSALAYIPLALSVNPIMWSAWGPFTFQTSRILHYGAYFLIGTMIGSYAGDRTLLSETGNLARKWARWAALAVAAFVAAAVVITIAMTSGAGQPVWSVLGSFMFVFSCAALSFGLTALFLRFVVRRTAMWDRLAENAYGIYLVHYAFVNWLQYAMVGVSMPGLAKFAFVTAAAIVLSWLAIAVSRRIPAVSKII